MPAITLDGLSCHFLERGPARQPRAVLMLVHGSGGDSSVWTRQLEGLSRRFRVVAPDLPGHGASGGGPAADIDEYARRLSGQADALGLEAFVLAGHSMGGMVAQRFALLFPGRVQGLVLTGTGMRIDIASGYTQLLRRDFTAACRLSSSRAYAETASQALRAEGRKMLERNGARTLSADLALCAAFDSRGWIGRLAVPVLVLSGARDIVAPPALARELAGAVPGAELAAIDDAGHMAMQEQSALFNRHVTHFIERRCLGTHRGPVPESARRCPE